MRWDPSKYVQFGDERRRPFFDLTGQVRAEAPREVVDLGCGPGDLTDTLGLRWPDARVVGLDSSQEMVDVASGRPQTPSNVSFALQDVRTWMPGPQTDVVVSNAVFQWIPDHADLVAAWSKALRPGAWLAFQMPGNFEAPSHALMREVAERPHWADRLGGRLRPGDSVREPSDYLKILLDAGLVAQAWETTYVHVLPGQDPVLEWVRGTGLRPILALLDAAGQAEFEAEYVAELRKAYPAWSHGTPFPFRRIFCAGYVPE